MTNFDRGTPPTNSGQLDPTWFNAQHLDSIMRSAEHFVFYRLAVDAQAEHGARVEFVSDSLRTILDVDPGAPFTSWFSRVHPDDLAQLEDDNSRAASEGIKLDRTMRMFHPTRNEWRWIRAVSHPVSNAHGVITNFNGFMLDVSDTIEASLAFQAERDFANAVMDTVGALVIVLDEAGRIVRFNRACESITGYSFEEVRNRLVWDFLLPLEEQQTVKEVFGELKQSASPNKMENYWLSKAGRRILIEWSNTAITDSQGKLVFGIGTGIDITARRKAELIIRKLSRAVEQVANGIVIVDQCGLVEYANPAYLAYSRNREEDLIGKPTAFLGTPDSPSDRQAQIWTAMKAGENWKGELELQDGADPSRWISLTASPVKNPDSRNDHFALLIEDITELKAAYENLEKLASFDTLTGLPNRRLFRDRLEHGLSVARRRGTQLALLYLDLDDFKRINDSLGHDAGDTLLCKIAARLSDCVREEDTIARLGGDEFVVLAAVDASSSTAALIAAKMLQSIRAPIMASEHEVIVTASVGITIAPLDSTDANTLLRNADLAMYRSKTRGRGGYEFFQSDMNLEASRRLSMEAELRHGLKAGKITPHFQPIVRLSDLQIVGFEALARWEHPERGQIPPGDFIPVAEDCGLIGELGEYLLQRSLGDIHRLREVHAADLYVSVNLSVRQAQDDVIADTISSQLGQHDLPGTALRLEITESLLMENFDRTRRLIEQLRHDLGTHIAVDDFGTGYSSLSYLKQLPIDVLKIDRSFIKDIPDDDDDNEITSAIVAMANALKKSVVAEGIETQAQLAFLRSRGCEYGQGYLLGRPAEPDQFVNSPLTITLS